MVKKIVVFGLVVVLVALAAKEYLRYHYFYKYKNVRARANSIEGSFSELEENLQNNIREMKIQGISVQ